MYKNGWFQSRCVSLDLSNPSLASSFSSLSPASHKQTAYYAASEDDVAPPQPRLAGAPLVVSLMNIVFIRLCSGESFFAHVDNGLKLVKYILFFYVNMREWMGGVGSKWIGVRSNGMGE